MLLHSVEHGNSMRRFFFHCLSVSGAFLALGGTSARAETGREAWLRYAPLEKTAAQKYAALPASVAVLGDSPLLDSAKRELIRGVRGMLARTLREEKTLASGNSIVLARLSVLRADSPKIFEQADLSEDGFLLANE